MKLIKREIISTVIYSKVIKYNTTIQHTTVSLAINNATITPPYSHPLSRPLFTPPIHSHLSLPPIHSPYSLPLFTPPIHTTYSHPPIHAPLLTPPPIHSSAESYGHL